MMLVCMYVGKVGRSFLIPHFLLSIYVQVLTPTPKDEARRARVAKVLEIAGLSYTGEAIFPSNR